MGTYHQVTAATGTSPTTARRSRRPGDEPGQRGGQADRPWGQRHGPAPRRPAGDGERVSCVWTTDPTRTPRLLHSGEPASPAGWGAWADAMVARYWECGPLVMMSASLCFATAQMLVKLLGRVQVFEIVAVRSAVNVALSVWVLRRKRASLVGAAENRRLLLLRGLLGSVAMTLFYFALRWLPLGDVSAIFFMNPAMVAVAGVALLGERLSWGLVGGIAMCVSGVVLVAQPPFVFSLFGAAAPPATDAGGRLLGLLFSLGASVCSAAVFVILRKLKGREDQNTTAIWFHFTSLVSSLPFCLASLPAPPVWPSAAEWGCLMGVVAGSFWGQICLTRAFALMPAGQGSAINTVQVVIAYLYGMLLLGERATLLGVLGAATIVAGAVAVNASKGEEGPGQGPEAGVGGKGPGGYQRVGSEVTLELGTVQGGRSDEDGDGEGKVRRRSIGLPRP